MRMNVSVVIDAVIRQTTILIAQLATTGGIRAPLSRLANQVFLNLVSELESQGVGRKVIADMFGLALRSYQMKVRRLNASATELNRSLWEAVLDFIQKSGSVTRAEVLRRFHADDDASVRGILRDLLETRLVYMTGKGNSTTYRIATDDDRVSGSVSEDEEATAALLWITVYREGPIDADDLAATLRLERKIVDMLLEQLLSEARIELDDPEALTYRSHQCVLPLGDPVGWEASLFDNFQATVAAICTKLRGGDRGASSGDLVGGSTYSFDLSPEHPCKDSVLALLRETRERVSLLRSEVTSYNNQNSLHGGNSIKATFYFGQNVVFEEEEVDL